MGFQHFETVSGLIFKDREVAEFSALEYETSKDHPAMCQYAQEE